MEKLEALRKNKQVPLAAETFHRKTGQPTSPSCTPKEPHIRFRNGTKTIQNDPKPKIWKVTACNCNKALHTELLAQRSRKGSPKHQKEVPNRLQNQPWRPPRSSKTGDDCPRPKKSEFWRPGTSKMHAKRGRNGTSKRHQGVSK